MATDITELPPQKTGAWDVDAFKNHFADLSIEDKRLVLYWLVHDLCGDRPERETDVSDPDGFLYMHLVPPGLREYFPMLQHPEIRAMLEESSTGPTFSHRQVLEELGITETESE
jgi:hypothetical protein